MRRLSWFRHYGWLVVAATPLLVYEVVALVLKRVTGRTILPPITDDVREFIHKAWWTHVLFIAFWAALTLHFLTYWP